MGGPADEAVVTPEKDIPQLVAVPSNQRTRGAATAEKNTQVGFCV
jgi:hypothetical protein